MVDQIITDEGGDLRRWRTELPNVIDDLGLDVFERALYGHYKRVCGANGGECYESTRTTADKIPGMSAAQVSIIRRRLADKGLVVEEIQHTVHIKIVDIWELNFAYYSVQDRPSIKGWTIPQLREWVNTSVYHLNTNEANCLPPKHPVYEVNDNGKKCLPGKTKNQPIKKKQIEKEQEIKNKADDPLYLPEAKDQLDLIFPQHCRGIEQQLTDLSAANWKGIDDTELCALAHCLKATGLSIPTKKGERDDWNSDIRAHVAEFGIDDLSALYASASKKMDAEGWNISRPGSLTKTMRGVNRKQHKDDDWLDQPPLEKPPRDPLAVWWAEQLSNLHPMWREAAPVSRDNGTLTLSVSAPGPRAHLVQHAARLAGELGLEIRIEEE